MTIKQTNQKDLVSFFPLAVNMQLLVLLIKKNKVCSP